MNNDFLVSMGLSVLFTSLKQFVKNPQSKENMKKGLLKLRNAINAAYIDDPDFA
jgi:hypothetical protein